MGDSSVCFSGPALALLGAIWLVLSGVIGTLFWQLMGAKNEALKEARSERDRAIEGFGTSLHVGETVVRRAGRGK